MKYKKISVLTFLVIVVVLGFFYFKNGVSDKETTSVDVSILVADDSIIYDEISIQIGEENFLVLVADTSKKRALGLSGREELVSGMGMLFVFEKSGDYPFWMKDMNFAIDIIWINEDKEIIYILENVEPETYPKSFTSEEDSLCVLEFPTGTVDEAEIKIGDKIIYDL